MNTNYMMSLLWMLVLVLANPALACSGGGDEKYRVIRKTDEGGKQLVVATEETARLFCQTNVPWKKCWWKPPRNGVREVSTYSNLKLSGFFLNFSHLQSKLQGRSRVFIIPSYYKTSKKAT